jgi:lysophospholipase L1-like esterase
MIAYSKVMKLILVIYLVSIHVFVAVLILKTDFIPKLMHKIGLRETASGHYESMLSYHKYMDENVPDSCVIFLGSSLTQGLAVAAVAPYSVNYGIGGETTTQLLEAIPHYRSLRRAKNLVLAIGINDILQGKQNRLHENYSKIIAALPRDVPLIWSSIMPVRAASWMRMKKTDIQDTNRIIKSLCERRGNCTFVDMNPQFKDSNNSTIPQYFLDDGIHLSPDGYRRWISALKKALRD